MVPITHWVSFGDAGSPGYMYIIYMVDLPTIFVDMFEK